MNSENSKTSDPHRLSLSLRDKVNLCCFIKPWNNIKKSNKNNKFKISASTWNEEFEFEGFESDIQDYFKYILKKHETVTDNPSIRKYVNKIENRMKYV